MAYRFRGRFSGTIFRMDARQRLYRKERRIATQRRTRRTRREALPEPPAQSSIAGDAARLLGDVLKNPQVQQAAIAMLPKLLGLPSPPRLPMLPPPR